MPKISKKRKIQKESLNRLISEIVYSEIKKNSGNKKQTLVLEAENAFYNIFIDPFVDVAKTATHGLKSTAQSIVGNTRKVAMQTAVALMPFVASSEVTRIGKEEQKRLKEKLASLDSQYADVLERNIEAIHAGNAATLMFLMNPAKMLGEYAAMWAGGKAVEVGADVAVNVLDFLEVLTAGAPGLNKKIAHLKQNYSELSEKASDFASHSIGGGHGSSHGAGGHESGGHDSGFGDYGDSYEGYSESVNKSRLNSKILLEQQPPSQPVAPKKTFTTKELNMKLGQLLSGFLANKEVKNVINSSKIAKEFKNTAIETVLARANQVAGFSQPEQFKKLMGPEYSKIEGQLKTSMPKDVSKEDMDKFNSDLVSELKKTYKTVYTKYLQQVLSGLPTDPKDTQKINSVLSKLS